MLMAYENGITQGKRDFWEGKIRTSDARPKQNVIPETRIENAFCYRNAIMNL